MKRGIILILLLLLPLVSGIEYTDVFEKNVDDNLILTCSDNVLDTTCSPLFNCTINVNYPNGTIHYNDTTLTRIGNGRYSLSVRNLTSLGFYKYKYECTNGTASGVSDDLYFKVTESGQVFSEAQGLGGLGIIISIIAISFFFMILGFRLSKNNQKALPLTLLFVVIAIFLVIYALVLGLSYSVDILEYDGLSNMQSAIFVSVLFLIGGIGIISFILMTFGFLREFGKGRMMKNYGEGFDPITQTYV